MNEVEQTCENCEYEHEDIEGTHCRHCIHSAEEHFKKKETHTNGWIPCSEGLPNDGQVVLVQVKPEHLSDEDETCIQIRKFDVKHGAYTWKMIGYKEWMIVDSVVAWQPLPEPYVKEGE